MDTYTYTTTSSADSAAAAGVGAGIMITYFVVLIAVYVVTAIFLGKLFKKANTESWIAWVPVYNSWKLLEIGGQKGWMALLSFVPIANIVALVFMVMAMHSIGKKLGKGDAFVLLAIFLPIVWIIILGVDDSTWNEAAGTPRQDQPVQALPVAQQPQATSQPESVFGNDTTQPPSSQI